MCISPLQSMMMFVLYFASFSNWYIKKDEGKKSPRLKISVKFFLFPLKLGLFSFLFFFFRAGHLKRMAHVSNCREVKFTIKNDTHCIHTKERLHGSRALCLLLAPFQCWDFRSKNFSLLKSYHPLGFL